MENQKETNQECCPKFDPTLWDDKTFEWDNKKFIKDKVFTLLYMPINFGKAMVRSTEKITKSGAVFHEGFCLSHHTSAWNMDLYLAVDKDVDDAHNTTISGKFYSKVYEGPFQETGKWQKDFASTLKSKQLNHDKVFSFYTTCPKCAKKYGKNYVVLIAMLE